MARLTLTTLLLVGAALAVRAEDPAAPPEVTLHRQGHGWILADAKGMTLYISSNDKNGKPACEGACTKTWLPLTAPADAKPFGEWSLATRADNAKQWAFGGKPLYRFAHDAAAGDTNGDDFQQQWSVALKPLPMPPGFGSLKSPLGQLLVDQKRMTLYTYDADTATRSACDESCAREHRPMEAWWLAATAIPGWTAITRADGTRQWAYNGKPLYRFAGDVNPGDVGGDRSKGWHAMVLQPAPPVPAWLTRQKTDGGEVYADAKGMTVYAYDLTRPRQFGIGIVRDMETPEAWRPVLAKETDKPVGQYSIVVKDDGTRQWAYKGNLLFTNVHDVEPGDINGVRSNDRLWRPIMTSGQTMPGTGN
jgi:predicted lipoprotein with Yx(FWY)xxD motif